MQQRQIMPGRAARLVTAEEFVPGFTCRVARVFE
jgi:hypothetical protein